MVREKGTGAQWESPWEKRGLAKWSSRGVLPLIAGPLKRLDPFGTQFQPVEPVSTESKGVEEVRSSVDSVRVMTWNLKFGGGRIDFFIDGHGDRVVMTKEEVEKHLEGIVEAIHQVDPDVLFVQEIDRASRRVAGVDQVRWILERTAFRHVVYASQWRSRLIPTHGLGHVDMGNAIFSKYPLEEGVRISLAPISDQDEVTKYFYVKRHLLLARLQVPNRRTVSLVNAHVAAFSQDDTKHRHLQRLYGELDRIDRMGEPFVVGADLNSVPPGTRQLAAFEDVAPQDGARWAANYEGEEELLTPFYERFYEAVDLEEYRQNNVPHFTHSSLGTVFWNRKLDYLMANRPFQAGSTMTHQDRERGGMQTMGLSDHAPLSACFRLETCE